MAKTFAAVLENQLLDTRSRMLPGRIEAELFDAVMRLACLKKSLQSLGPQADSELFRYFPVAAIAVLESHFKATIQTVVDEGSPYLERGLALIKERLRSISEIIPILHRKAVTVGDVVAHLLPFNSISSLEHTLGTLLELELKAQIGTTRDPSAVRNQLDWPQVVPDVEALWRTVSETFERRHILAHEAAANYVVTFEHATMAIESATLLTKAVDAVLWATVWKDRPFTQYEINVAAWNEHRETRAALSNALRRGRAIARMRDEQKHFRTLHRDWRRYSKEWTSWEEKEFAMGSIRPLIAARVRDRLLRAREQDIAVWISRAGSDPT